jgi:hypothetical protein
MTPMKEVSHGADNPGRSLAVGALSGRDVVVMALASSGLPKSVAVSLSAILATVAYPASCRS